MADAECVGSESVGRVIPNAPSPLPKRVRLPHTPPPWVRSGSQFFITICCTPRNRNQLATPRAFSVITNALEHYAEAEKLWTHLLVLMPDHLHVILSFAAEPGMARLVRDWKRFTAKAAGIRWQDGFFDHRLRGNDSFDLKADYIRMNPVRAGLVPTSDAWPFRWAGPSPAAR